MGNGKKTNANEDGFPRVSFAVDDAVFPNFLLILQYGFAIRAHVGCSVNDFLRSEIGLDSNTIEKIQTIFLEGSPVDDLDSAMVRDGATLALSAAMPGLVGATMRRGGVYASFRGSITYHETGEACSKGEGLVRLKLFNVLLGELGCGFLEKGVLVKSSDLEDFLKTQPPGFRQGCREVSLDGAPVEPESLNKRLSGRDRVFLTVTASKKDP